MKVHVVLLVAIFVAKVRGHPVDEEPVCLSTFDYNTKMLSKMLSMEFNFQKTEEQFNQQVKLSGDQLSTFQAELGRQNQYIESKLTEMEQKYQQNVQDSIERQSQQLMNKFVELERRTTRELEASRDSVSQKLQELDEAKSALVAVMDTADRSTVAFSANSISNPYARIGEKLAFSNVSLNEGDTFDGESGVFTAPVSGTYIFGIHLYIGTRHTFSAKIVVDGKPIARVRGGSSRTSSVVSGFGIAVLQKGDQVWTESIARSSYSVFLYDDEYGETSFKGALIHT